MYKNLSPRTYILRDPSSAMVQEILYLQPAALWERGHWHYTATRISQPHYYMCNGYSYFQSN